MPVTEHRMSIDVSMMMPQKVATLDSWHGKLVGFIGSCSITFKQ